MIEIRKLATTAFGIVLLYGCVPVDYDRQGETYLNNEIALPKNTLPIPTSTDSSELLATEKKEEITPSVLTKPKLSGTPLSLNLESNYLSKNYKGDVVLEQLFSKFENISKKDEYESTKDYLSRLQSYADDTIYAFIVDENHKTASYDADQQVLSVKITFLSTQPVLDAGGLGRERHKVTIFQSGRKNKDYVGTNSFGTYVKVESYLFEDYSLAVNNNLSLEGVLEKIVSIKMPPSDARFLGKDNVGVLLVCKIHQPTTPEPLAFNDYFRSKPTIDKPTDSMSVSHLVDVDLYQIWIFDKASGKVLLKQSI